MIFDVHSHKVENQNGGVLIALEGNFPHKDIFTNESLCAFMKKESSLNFRPCYYIDKFYSPVPDSTIVKYHPRLEKYTPKEVISDIEQRKPKLCIIDTLNQPFWSPSDYWKIARKFPYIQFLFSHAGGYDILEFLKFCDFSKNIWLDFSLTQTYFGWSKEVQQLKVVTDIIDYCLSSDRISPKILFGSDNPFWNQQEVIEKYATLKNAKMFFETNYVNLMNNI